MCERAEEPMIYNAKHNIIRNRPQYYIQYAFIYCNNTCILRFRTNIWHFIKAFRQIHDFDVGLLTRV